MTHDQEQQDTALVRHDIEAGGRPQGIVPRTLDEALRLSTGIVRSGMAPKGMDTPEKVFVAMATGMEAGLSPMAAIRSVAIINGRPSMWGDALLALARRSPLCVYVTETPIRDTAGNVTGYRCETHRRGDPEPTVREFTLDDAKRAQLTGKSGPWSQYPARMCQMRARSWALRDAYPDVLMGLGGREEAEDIPAVPSPLASGRHSIRRQADSVHVEATVTDAPETEPTPNDPRPLAERVREALADAAIKQGAGAPDVSDFLTRHYASDSPDALAEEDAEKLLSALIDGRVDLIGGTIGGVSDAI